MGESDGSTGAPGIHPPDGLLDAVDAYELALMANDLDALDAFFADGDSTMRGDAAGLLVGHERISRYRQGRGGAPQREIASVEVRTIDDDHALVVSVLAPLGGGRGQQTQLWHRGESGWVIDAAHVSGPARAIDPSVWRVVGTPLVAGEPGGALTGRRVAVKDLFDVAGHAVGAGVPAFLAESPRAAASAPAVAALLAAGADVQGIARTDEFAYSIAGRNPHYGTPPNPAVVGGIPGGSSNGPASAVALGQADIGLGTDTGGSVRVPASYQGLWGLRTTHGAVDRGGLLPLAPSFDTVGWLTRDSATLQAAAVLSLPSGDPGAVQLRRFAVCDAVTSLADADVRGAFDDALAGLGGLLDDLERVELPDGDLLFEAFRTVQAAEAWRAHGDWISAHPSALGADIAGRFAWASGFGPDEEEAARVAVLAARVDIERALDGRVLLLPAASSAAPQATMGAAENEQTRARTLRLTCIAGIAGMPALSVPLLRVAGGPVGLCLVGPRGSDLGLIEVGERMAHPRR
ncbi:Asp-tRNA(Asn)/Glu-tRNA(Gln) amidotransferase A subunit family amidase [Marisediminicola sp. UYEF4]|uniref:AtzH-like domain-containing protein n=1 Tax=Marisediminicola sp. UYEF4 TaxID=1756384 RepID=UPI003392DE16